MGKRPGRVLPAVGPASLLDPLFPWRTRPQEAVPVCFSVPWEHMCMCRSAWPQVWTEYKVIHHTSALTLIIAGTVKEIITGKCVCE